MSVVKSNIKLTSKNIFDIVSLPYLLWNQLFITPVTSGVSNSFQFSGHFRQIQSQEGWTNV